MKAGFLMRPGHHRIGKKSCRIKKSKDGRTVTVTPIPSKRKIIFKERDLDISVERGKTKTEKEKRRENEKTPAESFEKAREEEIKKRTEELKRALEEAEKTYVILWVHKQKYSQKKLLEIQRMDVNSREFKYLLGQVNASREIHGRKAKAEEDFNKEVLGFYKNISGIVTMFKRRGMPKFKPYNYEQVIKIIQDKINKLEDKKKK
ncbi:MAG: hypothetical protein AB1467_05865 [Candidatus Diapherotrites archaeon]